MGGNSIGVSSDFGSSPVGVAASKVRFGGNRGFLPHSSEGCQVGHRVSFHNSTTNGFDLLPKTKSWESLRRRGRKWARELNGSGCLRHGVLLWMENDPRYWSGPCRQHDKS